ncbi:hypothetical protein [Nostoc commune]|nr:hypothetical protein [Nostoc commune]
MMAGVEIKGDEAMIQALAEFSKRNASHVKGILNLTIPLSESCRVWQTIKPFVIEHNRGVSRQNSVGGF